MISVSRSRGSRNAAHLLAGLALIAVTSRPAGAQTISDVLSFLVKNRSIPTDDFIRDEQAAQATLDTIADFFVLELGTMPITSASGPFTYRFDPALGTATRSSLSFGPSFTERSLTGGKEQAAFAITVRTASFDTLDGRSLRDGTLVSTASVLRGQPQPFDVETVTLRIRSQATIFSANYGVTDRLDISGAAPIVRVTLSGERVDTYRGRAFVQATGSASSVGLGDLVFQAKYNFLGHGGTGLAVGGETRLPTGNRDNLLGAGKASVRPRLMGSIERERLGLHGDVGYSFRGVVEELGYAGALTYVASPKVTLVGEAYGRRLNDFDRLTDTTQPHPTLAGVSTIRLTSLTETRDRIVAVAGVKWNIAGTWLLTANVLRPLGDVGLNANWMPVVTLDYSYR
jgi:Putative MetA-pathway of phenol degradation